MNRNLLKPILISIALGALSLDAAASSLDQAVAQVRQQTGGRVVSAETVEGEHRIRVLTANGQVRLVRVPAGKAGPPGQR